jgi:hypothetical protein
MVVSGCGRPITVDDWRLPRGGYRAQGIGVRDLVRQMAAWHTPSSLVGTECVRRPRRTSLVRVADMLRETPARLGERLSASHRRTCRGTRGSGPSPAERSWSVMRSSDCDPATVHRQVRHSECAGAQCSSSIFWCAIVNSYGGSIRNANGIADCRIRDRVSVSRSRHSVKSIQPREV